MYRGIDPIALAPRRSTPSEPEKKKNNHHETPRHKSTATPDADQTESDLFRPMSTYEHQKLILFSASTGAATPGFQPLAGYNQTAK